MGRETGPQARKGGPRPNTSVASLPGMSAGNIA
jgi:hypothetical protein